MTDTANCYYAHQPIHGACPECGHCHTCGTSPSEVDRLRARIHQLETEIASGAEHYDRRLRYVTIQVDRALWLHVIRKHAPELLPPDVE